MRGWKVPNFNDGGEARGKGADDAESVTYELRVRICIYSCIQCL